MRIISQDGMIDIPYEQVCVGIDYQNEKRIYATGINLVEETGFTIAKYSSPEKAKKAIEMLHGAYVVHNKHKNMDIELQLKIEEAVGIEKTLICGGVFKFPKEDEI